MSTALTDYRPAADNGVGPQGWYTGADQGVVHKR